MKITLVCHDIPYPHIHGGRVDMWRRIKAFAQYGVELQLICWFSHTPTDVEIAQMQKYVKFIHLLQFKNTFGSITRRLFDLWQYPLEVTSRIVRGNELNNLLKKVDDFHPDLIWLDGIHGGEVASVLSKTLNIPLVTRSHNIEHLYYKRLFKSATGLSKLKRYLSVCHLARYEKQLLQKSTFFYDISVDDLKFWESQSLKHGRYLPPLIEFDLNSSTLENDQNNHNKYDVVFLGNLYSNNNVAGIIWFLKKVFPLIRSSLPKIRVLIAGANPVKEIRQLCQAQQGLYLSINPVSSAAVYNSGRVLINPVLTGSGVSIKSLEMLMTGKPIVSTPQGIAGLPAAVNKQIKVTGDASAFATEIINLLSSEQVYYEPKALKTFFGIQIIQGVVSELKSLL